ncbi:hypothetical protein [Streptomyces sp. NBC_00199]|uniref:hypothetical protein n=1 Tax=Streptomyces sp. NBC_00199 TaxID=2975678 RepID=UPI00225A8459|nr:hypothetical protein [Streptomyces sp. NBC_00199]MCX5265292.1 hypothetical protein [Streptomyces sp. NBC_00199]
MGRVLREFLVEALGELVLTAVACLAVGTTAVAFVWGWERGSLVAGGVGVVLLVFIGYGGWELLRPPKPGRRGRLAGVAAATTTVAALLFAYAWSCGCL